MHFITSLDSLTLADAAKRVASFTEDRNMIRIKRQFKMLTINIANQLQSLNVSVKEARDHIGNLIDKPRKFYSRTSRCQRFIDLFRLMGDRSKYKPLWSYNDYGLVKDLITIVDVDKDSKDKMKSLLQVYISELIIMSRLSTVKM